MLRYFLGLGLVIGLRAQVLPSEALYFQGKLSAFSKKAQSSYSRAIKRGSSQDPNTLAAGLAYALALGEAHRYVEAREMLQQFAPVLQNPGISPQLRFYSAWIQGRVLRGRGLLTESVQAFQSAALQAQTPWQRLLIGAESVENLLLLGNALQAADSLRSLEVPSQFEEPYGSYLRDRFAYLKAWKDWQRGAWDSLPPTLGRTMRGQHADAYQAEYAYLLAQTAFLQGEVNKGVQYLKVSQRFARKTVYKGQDLILRAEAQLLVQELYRSARGTYGRRVQRFNPLLKLLRDRRTPFTYATVDALQHLVEAARITDRTALAENILGLYIQQGEGVLSSRLQRVASRLAQAQYRATISLSYASQGVQKLGSLPFATLEKAQSLTDLGRAALLNYRYAQADTAFSQAAEILAALGEPEGPLTFSIREALASRFVEAGQYARAQKLLLRQRATYERLLPTPTRSLPYLRILLLTSDLSLRLADPAAADTLLRRAERPIEALPVAFLSEKIAFYELKGDLAQALGQFRDAERSYLEAVRLRQRQRKGSKSAPAEESGSLLRLALLYQRTGRLSRAKEVYQKITTIYQNSRREDAEVAKYYIGLTDFYILAGDYLKAEESGKKARELNRTLQGSTSPAYVEALLTSARVEAALGRYDKQQALLQEAFEAQKRFYEGRPSLAVSRTLYLLAENALSRGRLDSASLFLQRSGEEADRAQTSAPLEFAALSLDIGGVWLGLDSLAYADNRISAAKAVLDEQVPLRHPDRMRAFLYQARLKRTRGEYLAALADYKRWLSLWTSIYSPNHPEYPFYLAEMAEVHWLARDFSGAKSKFEKAASLIIFQVDRLFNGLSETEKTRYWARVRRVLEGYYAFSFLQGSPSAKKKAYETYLATKALLLSESAQLRAKLASSPDTTLQRVFKAWQDQKEYVVRLYSYSPNDLKELNINLAEEENRLNELEKQLTQYVGDIRMQRPTWQALRKALPKGVAAVDWIRLRLPQMRDSVLYVAVVTTPELKDPLYVTLPNGRALEGYYFFRYSQSILNFERDTTSYTAYWKPVLEKLPPTTERLYVCSDGVYYQINPSTIPLPQGGYLADKYQVIHYTRLASLTKPPKPFRYFEGKKAFLIADPDYAPNVASDSLYVPPLPGTAEEIRAIRDILQSEAILPYVHTRGEASEPLLYEANSPYILHIATHGIFLPYDERLGELIGVQNASALANPLFRSALLLASAGRTLLYGSTDVSQDGILNAYELLALRLQNTQLVALSACETGLGEVQNGEGVYGLQRAFLLAGARNLILSLWKVDDEATRDFMICFYTEWLRKKLPLEEAFWNTQTAMRSARNAPYFWGAFILVKP